MDTTLSLYDVGKKLLQVSHEGRSMAETEIAACRARIRRGEATHMRVEAVSFHGSTYIEDLRAQIIMKEEKRA